MTVIKKESFGTASQGKEIFLYTLTNDTNMCVKISTYGGAVVSCVVPDKNNNPVDVVLGYDNVENYEKQDKYIGSIIGRHANRIENASFTLNGKIYPLYANNGRNHSHGGKYGFDKKIWEAETADSALLLTYTSPDGEEGYPGNLKVTVAYSLTENNTLKIDYKAVSDQDTVCSLTNHSYFNLNGHDSGDVLSQYIRLLCDEYTEANNESLPNGKILPVENTPMDLRKFVRIGDNIDSSFPQLHDAGGYDNNWVVPNYDGSLKEVANAYSKESGISLCVYSTLPGLQFYTGNFLTDELSGKNGAKYEKRTGFCIETQYFPNSMMHDNFKKPILLKGDLYHEITEYQFGIIK